MRRKQKRRMMTGLITAAGAVSAFFGARALVNWMRRRSEEQAYAYRYQRSAAIPTTGMADMSYPESNLPGTVLPSGARVGMPGVGLSESIMPESSAPPVSETGVSDADVVRDELDRTAIPTTGMLGQDVMDTLRTEEGRREEHPREHYYTAAGAGDITSQAGATGAVAVSSLVGPLIVHLLSYHNMMEMLHRRREALETSTGDPDIPDVREGGADAIGSLEAQLPEFDRAMLERGSLQERIVQQMERIRDTLKNKDYSDDQLFKIYDEMRSGICKILELIHKAEEDNVTGFEDVKQAYKCR